MFESRISMTWPQYKRRQCSVGQFTIRLSQHEASALSTMLMRYPQPTSITEIIESLWEDPDFEPDEAEQIAYSTMRKLRFKLGAYRIEVDGPRGYVIVQTARESRMVQRSSVQRVLVGA